MRSDHIHYISGQKPKSGKNGRMIPEKNPDKYIRPDE